MADWSDLPFAFNSIDYILQLDTLRDRSEAIATEVEDARLGEATLDVLTGNLNTEITAARQGEVNLVTNIANYVKDGTLTASFDFNSQKGINVADGTLNTDLVNLQQTTALILGGAAVTNIDVTSISNGTATTGQRIVAGASNPVGEDNDILTLDVGALSADKVVGANAGATALEEKDLTGISTGSLTALTLVQAKSDSSGLQDYDNDLEISMASLYLYDNG